MTANGLCELCGKITGYYLSQHPKGWYCDEHRRDHGKPVEKVVEPPKPNRHERRKARK